MTQLTDFLTNVVTTPQGQFNLCMRSEAGVWHESWFGWPRDLKDIEQAALAAANEYDVYFSSYLYAARDSHKEFVLPSRTIQQDLDTADIDTLPLEPSVLVQTSPGRHQGYWFIDGQLDLELQELLSRRLAYAIPNCDHSGWTLGHKVRTPLTLNHKYLDGPHPVTLVSQSNKRYSIEELELLPDVDTLGLDSFDESFVNYPPQEAPDGVGPYELLEVAKESGVLPGKVYAEYLSNIASTDRSAALWALMLGLFRAGLTKHQVYWVARSSPNNKFARLKYNGERDLAKDVLRAELAVHSKFNDVRAIISEIRKQAKMSMHERRHLIYQAVQGAMKLDGDFFKVHDGGSYFIDRNIGRPVAVDVYSDYLDAILYVKYGLNKVEQEHGYTVHALRSYTMSLPETTRRSVLSYYDQLDNRLLVHTGRKVVYEVTPGNVRPVTDGAYDTIFPWGHLEPYTAIYDPEVSWRTELFSGLTNVTNLNPEETNALLSVWYAFIFFRNLAQARPTLAFFAPPGSGKTTQSRKFYSFMYGPGNDVSGLSGPGSFDMATTSRPLLVLDNLDTWERWLPDRLAQASGNTEVIHRKLYSNTEIVRLKRQAMLVVTAHDPKFGRADVTDRLLILALHRLQHFEPEGPIIERILTLRNKMWGSLLHDLSLVLCNPIPPVSTIQLRIEDFARLGEWIAMGLGCLPTFRDALTKLKGTQFGFNQETEHVLVNALTTLVSKRNPSQSDVPITQDDLFSQLMSAVPDQAGTFMQRYKNPMELSKRLINLHETLADPQVGIRCVSQVGKGGMRLWLIQRLETLV